MSLAKRFRSDTVASGFEYSTPQPIATDNGLQTSEDVKRFIDELVEKVIRGTNIYLLYEMAWVIGPTFWMLCCFNRDEFAATYHLGRYKGMNDDPLMCRIRRSERLRGMFVAFRAHWCKFAIDTPLSKQHQWLNMRGEPFSIDDEPAVMRQCKENPYEYIIEWYDGNGNLDRRELDSKGNVVDSHFGFPCSVVSRDYVVDEWSAWDDTVDDLDIFQEHAAVLEVRYQYRDGRVHGSVSLFPDSEEERRSFIESGYALTHPLVKRSLPHLLWDLGQSIEPFATYFDLASSI